MIKKAKKNGAGDESFKELCNNWESRDYSSSIKITSVVFIASLVLLILSFIMLDDEYLFWKALINIVLGNELSEVQFAFFIFYIQAIILLFSMVLAICIYLFALFCLSDLMNFIIYVSIWFVDKSIVKYLKISKQFEAYDKLIIKDYWKAGIVSTLLLILGASVLLYLHITKIDKLNNIFEYGFIILIIPIVIAMTYNRGRRIGLMVKEPNKRRTAYYYYLSKLSSVIEFGVLIKFILLIMIMAITIFPCIDFVVSKTSNIVVKVPPIMLSLSGIVIQYQGTKEEYDKRLIHVLDEGVLRLTRNIVNNKRLATFFLNFLYRMTVYSCMFILGAKSVLLFLIFKRKRKRMMKSLFAALIGFGFAELVYWTERLVYHTDSNTLSILAFVTSTMYFIGVLYKGDNFSYKYIR